MTEMIYCEICGGTYKQIVPNHLKYKHRITYKKYKEQYPNTCLMSRKTREKRFKANRGSTRSLATRNKLSILAFERYRRGWKNPLKGKKIPSNSRRLKKDNPMWNPETARKTANTLSRKIRSGEISLIPALEGQERKPTRPESFLTELLKKYELPFKYTGDGGFFIGHKNPDFVNVNGKNQVIELYGDYWHRNDNPQDKITAYKKNGYDCLVIWEHELKDELSIVETIRRFIDA